MLTRFIVKENNEFMKNIFKNLNKCLMIGTVLLSACSTNTGTPEVQTVYVGYDSPAPIPAGVVRYCWEEPVVEFQENGPGLDADKRWYNPSFVAVRMVKQGKWRPCRNVASEIKGETKNEY
jgi:hypothetical protein